MFPPQRESAADWVRDQNVRNTTMHTAANSGLRPKHEVPMYPLRLADLLTSNSASWTDLWAGTVQAEWPRVTMSGTVATDTGTTAELRVTINGTAAGTVVPVAAFVFVSWTQDRLVLPPGALFGVTVSVQARVVSGPGSVHVGIIKVVIEP